MNVLIGGLSILVGSFIAGSLSPLNNVLLAVISGSLIAAAANSINDFFDVNIDKINKPYRPIAAGLLTRSEAFIFSMLLFITGAVSGSFINVRAGGIALFACILLYLYSARLKRTVLWGNLTVSLMTAFAFIYGGVAVDLLDKALIPAGFAFLFHFGREIIKDVEDHKGDNADNARTLPIIYGNRIAFI
jgi:geranylgeranylglycerol-phosphate geranylgeranyltransferase